MSEMDPTPPPILGLVLAGGRSRRMGQDKAALRWGADGVPLWRRQIELLRSCDLPVAVSIRQGQELEDAANVECIADAVDDAGPLSGFLSAWKRYPEHALLVVACDLPLLDHATVQYLLDHRDPNRVGTAYESANDHLPEPLCALWEPASRALLEQSIASDRYCPRKVLINAEDDVLLLSLPNRNALENANTPEELSRLKEMIGESEVSS
ncbi:MAG: molybdenum cofactor guanylyltransferase [Verrucomicrobiota bacterium]